MRREMRRMRAELTEAELTAAGEAVEARVLALPEVAEAHTVLCYVSFRREVPTRGLLTALGARGIEVAVPRMTGPGVLEARRIEGPLVDGPMGIPTSDGPRVDAVDVCLCPGLAFDRRGGRLGYGGGYYDQWLAAHPCRTVALAMDAALVEEVPLQPHDHRMDLIVTPERVLRIGGVGGG